MKVAGHLGSLESRRHFLAVAATAMRQVLIDHARQANRERRGGNHHTVSLQTEPAVESADVVDVVALNECLMKLATLDARVSRVVELRLFGAMTIPEISETLDVSPRTVDADWAFARAWLRRELNGG